MHFATLYHLSLSIGGPKSERAPDVLIDPALSMCYPDYRQAGTVNVTFPPSMKRKLELHRPVVALYYVAV